jgi:hypothetical protein
MQSSQTTAQIGAPASTSGDMEPQSPTLADSGYSTIITHRKQQGDGMSDKCVSHFRCVMRVDEITSCCSRRIHTYPPEQYGCYSHPIHVFMASSLKNRSLSDSNNLNTLITQQENMMSVSDVKRHFDLAFAQQHTKNTFAPVGSTVPPAAVGHTGKTNVFPGLLAHVPDRHVVTQGMLTII